MLRSLLLASSLASAVAYPLYVQFEYTPGVEYDVTSTATSVRVAASDHTPLHLVLPVQCDGNRLRATKLLGSVRLEFPCDDGEEGLDMAIVI